MRPYMLEHGPPRGEQHDFVPHKSAAQAHTSRPYRELQPHLADLTAGSEGDEMQFVRDFFAATIAVGLSSSATAIVDLHEWLLWASAFLDFSLCPTLFLRRGSSHGGCLRHLLQPVALDRSMLVALASPR